MVQEHPDAFFMLRVPYKAVRQPPDEPAVKDWHWDVALMNSHRERVRLSLETFVNTSLERLDGMVRTGWFIIGRVRAVVAELREVPHGPGEQRRG